MALVKCRECGKKISDTAEVCPHCGKKSPVPTPKEITANNKAYGIGFIISIILAIGLLKSCFGGPKQDNKYYQCLQECNTYHNIVGAGTKSANCYSKCDNDLVKRHKEKQTITITDEFKISHYISKFISKYEKTNDCTWTIEQHASFLNGINKDKIQKTHIGDRFLDSTKKLIGKLKYIENSAINEDIFIDRSPVSTDILQVISDFNQKVSSLIHSESYISNLLENQIQEELDKIVISEPTISQCPGKIDYKLTNNSSLNIKYIKFGIPDFKDYRFQEFTHLREDWYYDLDRMASAPSFIFKGNNKNMTLNLVDSSTKTAHGRLPSGEQMAGTYFEAYEIMKSSINMVKYDLQDSQQQYCFAYKKPIIREIVFALDSINTPSSEECSLCEPYKKKALDIYQWKDYAKTKKDKFREEMRMIEFNIPKATYNKNIYRFYEKNKDIFTDAYLLHLIDKKENINMLETIKEKVIQIFNERTNLDTATLPLMIELTDNGVDFKIENVSFQKLLNTLNAKEQKEIAIQNFISKFKIKEK